MYSKNLKDICDTKIGNVISRNVKLKGILFDETDFLDNNVSVSDRIYYVKNDIVLQIMCPVCRIKKSKPDRSKTYISACSTKCANNRIDPETGLTKKEQISLKLKAQRSEIDPESGLTRSRIIANKFKENNNKVDVVTGLTNRELTSIKKQKTYDNIDPDTGLTIRERSKKRLSITLNSVRDSGLTLAQEVGKKTSDTKSVINPSTGKSYHYDITKKSADTMRKKDSNGLTIFEKSGKKISENSRSQIYIKRLNNFPIEYKLLITKDEYIKSDSNLLKYSCNECGSIRESYWPYIRCIKCYPYNKSIGENQVLEFCKSLTSEVQSNPRNIIPPLELDVYIPNHNLAIEYNGLFWHSSDSVETENLDYHLNKTDQCASKGIQLFHIFENEWLDPQKQIIWKSIIRNKLGKSQRIFARKTKVTRITSKDTKEFLDSNHLQSTCVSSVNLGLVYDDELVAIMTFGRSRYDKKIEWELLRYCGKLNTSVVGGAGKLLKAFRREYEGSIISYADKRRSSGNLYDRLGFELSHESAPNYWYWKSGGLESRIGYQKHKLKDKLDVFDEKLSESENMYNNGYRKIYDCGNQVWKLN